ncbi:MAG: filamentous hemagglutinin N-terminal domain-containing protein [Pleurocapsa sp. MO_226.B13]|nr:filamentous hemagglutinin N-terminal domain-containing protein [Pleurocapsa sp. MO_226.B13]
MKPWRSLILGLFIAKAIACPSQAQIVPDGTTNTVIDPTDNGTRIDAGDRAGNNLFHSFQEFSVPNGSEAFFNNANDIVNIFSRVTGGNISNIDGLLKANGDANLFLINPAGIVFGEGAALDLGGSFVTSTAESIIFTDNVEFSATDTDNPPLLTMNQPLGLNFGNKIGDIAINGSNLQVNNGRTLALFGGNITLTEGQIIAPGANIELGGLTQPGQISFEQLGDEINFNSINFPEGIARGDITLVNGAEVDVRAAGGGSINVQARNLELSGGELGGSSIKAGITSESNSTTARAGNINLNATENISLSQRSSILNVVEESVVGNAGEININTTNLSLVEESKIDTSTFGRGNGGAIAIDAAETISIDGEVAVKNSSFLADDEINPATFGNIASLVQSTATGNSGEIEINTANLSLTRGGIITTSNIDGRGDTGKITINATDTISLDGANKDLISSTIFNIVGTTKAGNSNNIEITTDNLFIQRGVIATSNIQGGDSGDIRIKASNTITVEGAGGIYTTAGEGAGTAEIEEVNAGEIEIVTKNLNLIKGGTISAGIFGVGNAGTITIQATDTISIDGSTRAVTRVLTLREEAG